MTDPQTIDSTIKTWIQNQTGIPKSSFPCEISNFDNIGRGMKAAKDIEKGESRLGYLIEMDQMRPTTS